MSDWTNDNTSVWEIMTHVLNKLCDKSINDTGAWKTGIGLKIAKCTSYVMRLKMVYVPGKLRDRFNDYTSA